MEKHIHNQLAQVFSTYPLSLESQRSVEKAVEAAKDHVGTEHLVFGLLSSPAVHEVVTAVGIPSDVLNQVMTRYLQDDPNAPETDGLFTSTAYQVFSSAQAEMLQRNASEISPVDLLFGMLTQEGGMGFLLLWTALTGTVLAREQRTVARNALLKRMRETLTR